MKSMLTTTAIAIGLLAVPVATLAATYQYVGTDGTLKTETANTAYDALNQAPNIAPHSGVILVPDTTKTTTTTVPVTVVTTSAPTASTTAANLRVTLNNLLAEHVQSSLDVLRDSNDGNTTAMAGALQEQDANAVDLAAAIGSVYGSSVQATFLQEFRDHIMASNAYTTALKNGSVANQQTALANLDTQLQNLSHTLANANPHIDYNTLLSALRQHEALINQSSVDYNKGDITDAYTVERQAITQIEGGADYIANAIVAEYPSMFAN